jgi:hypothetical protein
MLGNSQEFFEFSQILQVKPLRNSEGFLELNGNFGNFRNF